MARYFYHVNKDNASVYFMVPKCATRTIMGFFNIPKGFLLTGYNPDKYKDYYKWGFVRNPYDRLVSAYQNKIVEQFEGGLAKYRDIKSFKDFILHLETINIVKSDRHIKPQSLLLPTDMSMVGKLEDFNTDLRIICEMTGRKFKLLPKINKSGHKGYKDYYNTRTRKIVHKLYREDMERFNYGF